MCAASLFGSGVVKEFKDEERAEKRKKDFAHALSGMDRAVQWIREHQDVLNGFTLHLYPDREFGVEVNLSFIDGDRQEAVKKLFAGRVVKKKKRDEEEKFELIDEDLQIRFVWLVWTFEPKPEAIEESLVL